MPIISTLIPLLIGIILGNLDKELGKFLSSGMPFMIFMLGWSIGASINLIDALSAGLSGALMTIFYYIFTFLPLFFAEKMFMKREGISSVGLSTMAGLSASIPLIVGSNNPDMMQYAPRASAIISFGVVFTALISPALGKYFANKQKK